MANNGPRQPSHPHARTKSLESFQSASYLRSCNKVELDAYERVLGRLKDLDRATQQVNDIQEARNRLDAITESEKRTSLRQELMRTTQYLRKQIDERTSREMEEQTKERDEYKQQCESMPPNVISIFPRITETPAEVRRQRETRRTQALERDLRGQIEGKREEKTRATIIERETELGKLKRLAETAKREGEEAKEKERAKKERYGEELRRDIQCKEAERANKKRLESIEYEGVSKIVALEKGEVTAVPEPSPVGETKQEAKGEEENKAVAEDQNEGKTIEGDIETVEKFFESKDHPIVNENKQEETTMAASAEKPNNPEPEAKTDDNSGNKDSTVKKPATGPVPEMDERRRSQLATLLARKQRKADELLQRIDELEQRANSSGRKCSLPVRKLRAVLSPAGYRCTIDGKSTHISGSDAEKIVSTEQSQKKTAARSALSSRASNTSRSSRARSQNGDDVFGTLRSSAAFGNTMLERAQKVAYERYIAHLERQV